MVSRITHSFPLNEEELKVIKTIRKNQGFETDSQALRFILRNFK